MVKVGQYRRKYGEHIPKDTKKRIARQMIAKVLSELDELADVIPDYYDDISDAYQTLDHIDLG